MSVMARVFKVSGEMRSKALRRAVLGPDDVQIFLTAHQRKAMSGARSDSLPQKSDRASRRER